MLTTLIEEKTSFHLQLQADREITQPSLSLLKATDRTRRFVRFFPSDASGSFTRLSSVSFRLLTVVAASALCLLLCALFSHPGYFGKVGMRYFHKTKQQFHCPTVNVDRLWTLVSERLREQYASADAAKDKVPVIDVSKFGFYKVLGNGPLPAQPVIVKAKFFSKKAERKIKAVGGVAVLTA